MMQLQTRRARHTHTHVPLVGAAAYVGAVQDLHVGAFKIYIRNGGTELRGQSIAKRGA